MNYTHAIVCSPGKSYKNAISSNDENKNIDIEKAQFQHQEYCKILEKIGLKLVKLPTNENYPDSCFVQDPCVVFGNTALITKQKATSRNGEGKAIQKVIKLFKDIQIMDGQATMDGGDAMVTSSKVFIGVSDRTNLEGISQYKKLFSKEGLPEVIPVLVEKCLHLMTGVTYIGKNTVVLSKLVDESYFKGFKKIYVLDKEEYATNCLSINDYVIMPKGYPKVKKQIQKNGFQVIEIDISEFKKADGGVTCLSLLW